MESNNKPKVIEIKTIDFSTFGIDKNSIIQSNVESTYPSIIDLDNKITIVEQSTVTNLEKITELEQKVSDTDSIRVTNLEKITELEQKVSDSDSIKVTIEESLTKIIRTNIPINIEDDVNNIKIAN